MFTFVQGLLNFSYFQKVDTVSLYDFTIHIFFEKWLFRTILSGSLMPQCPPPIPLWTSYKTSLTRFVSSRSSFPSGPFHFHINKSLSSIRDSHNTQYPFNVGKLAKMSSRFGLSPSFFQSIIGPESESYGYSTTTIFCSQATLLFNAALQQDIPNSATSNRLH